MSAENHSSASRHYKWILKGWVLDDPPSINSYSFEEIDILFAYKFFENYWYIPYCFSVLYIVGIFKLKHWMKLRPGFQLKMPLFLWNICLSVFSIVASVRSTPILYYVLKKEEGFYKSICIRKGLNQANIFWGFVFVLSKILECGDTVFIVLRKKPLIFLQWYHHVVAMLLSWTVAVLAEPINRWFVAINYFIHSLMYSYYALKTIGVPVPGFVATTITFLQFIQMIAGIFLNFASMYMLMKGHYCARETYSLIAFFAVYGSFSIMFGNILYRATKTKHRTLKKMKLY